MKKKILAAVMAATMVFSLVACGSSDAGSNAATGSASATTGSANAGTESASAGTTSSSSSGDMIKVGIINNDPNESGYRTANDKDLKAMFTEENGYDASFAYSLKNDEQIAAAQKFIQDEVDYLLISAAGTSGWDSVLQDAQAAGIQVILFDRTIDADESLYVASIVSDMAKEGQTAVDWLASQNLDTYNIIHIQGVMGSAAQIGRTGALDEQVAANDNWNMVTQQTAEWNAETAQQIVQSVIDSGKEFNVIYAENDDMAKGAVAALDKANISHGVGKDVIVMGFDYGPMVKHERNAREKGDLFTEGERVVNADNAPKGSTRGKVYDLLIPVIVLIVCCVIGMIYVGGFFEGVGFIDAFSATDASVGLPWGSLIALLFAIVYYMCRRLVSFKEAMNCLTQGFIAMVPAMLILTFAVTLKTMTGLLGADVYVAGLMQGASAGLTNMLPAIIFLVACFLAFASGTSWGTFGILIPIVTGVFTDPTTGAIVPGAEHLIIIGVAACLAGAVMGDHCSPISDTTIMASAGAQCNHINHVSTQVPYVLTVAAISFVTYIIAGFVQNVVICLVIGILLTLATLVVLKRVFGEKAVVRK